MMEKYYAEGCRLRSLPLLLTVLLCWLLPSSAANAQEDLAREIQEIAKRVESQLQEINRMLLEAARKDQPRSQPRQLLEQSMQQGTAVQTGIEELIDKLTQMKNQSSSSSSSSSDQDQQQSQNQDQQQQSQSGNQQQNQGQRRENSTPDFVQQPGEEPGQQQQQGQAEPGQPQPAGRPDSGMPDQGQGENRVGNNPDDGETGPASRSDSTGSWGDLQSYTNFLKQRGSPPQVPEKYRKYWEAYLRSSREQAPPAGGSQGTPKPPAPRRER